MHLHLSILYTRACAHTRTRICRKVQNILHSALFVCNALIINDFRRVDSIYTLPTLVCTPTQQQTSTLSHTHDEPIHEGRTGTFPATATRTNNRSNWQTAPPMANLLGGIKHRTPCANKHNTTIRTNKPCICTMCKQCRHECKQSASITTPRKRMIISAVQTKSAECRQFCNETSHVGKCLHRGICTPKFYLQQTSPQYK